MFTRHASTHHTGDHNGAYELLVSFWCRLGVPLADPKLLLRAAGAGRLTPDVILKPAQTLHPKSAFFHATNRMTWELSVSSSFRTAISPLCSPADCAAFQGLNVRPERAWPASCSRCRSCCALPLARAKSQVELAAELTTRTAMLRCCERGSWMLEFRRFGVDDRVARWLSSCPVAVLLFLFPTPTLFDVLPWPLLPFVLNASRQRDQTNGVIG